MKNFNYTARDKTGALVRGAVQAADRVAALRELKTQSYEPISVTEGRAAVGGPKVALSPRTLAYAVGCVALTLAALVCVRVMKATSVQKKAPRTIEKAVGGVAPKKEQTTKAVPLVPPASKTQETVSVLQPEVPVVTNAQSIAVESGGTNAAKGSEQTVQPIRGAQKRLAEAIEKGLPTEPLFKNECESILAFYVRPGEPPSPHPLPDNIEELARQALAENIVVSSDDTPEQVQEKEMVAWLKEDMRKFIANGGTAQDYLALAQERQEEEATLYMDARKVLSEYYSAGNTDETLAAYKALNETLKTKGIAPLPLPGGLRKKVK